MLSITSEELAAWQRRNLNEHSEPRLDLSSGGSILRRKAKREMLREFKRQIRTYRIDPVLWFIHFGDILPDEAVCADCLDFMVGVCPGGKSPKVCKGIVLG